MKTKFAGKRQHALRGLAFIFVLSLAFWAVSPVQADEKDPPPPAPTESKVPQEDKKDNRDEKKEQAEIETSQQPQQTAQDCYQVSVIGDAPCQDDDIPVEGQGDDLYTGENTDPELDSIATFGGDVDPVEGFVPGIESIGSDILADCALSACNDGGDIFDKTGLLTRGADLDICLLGVCVADPVDGSRDQEDEPGQLDNCQISVTCETGDESSGQGSSDDDSSSGEICEQEEDGDEDCEDDTTGQYPGEHYDPDGGTGSDHDESSSHICSQNSAGGESCEDNTHGEYTGEHYEPSDTTDSDHDGLPDEIEENIYSDPHNPDSDGDGLWDGTEYYDWGTDPTDPDTDGDGMDDDWEVNFVFTVDLGGEEYWHSDPTNPDTDGDGITDFIELMNGTNPNKDDSYAYCEDAALSGHALPAFCTE